MMATEQEKLRMEVEKWVAARQLGLVPTTFDELVTLAEKLLQEIDAQNTELYDARHSLSIRKRILHE